MDTQDLKEELSKILELSSTRIDNTDATGMGLKKSQSHVSLKAVTDPESSIEIATGNSVPIGISFTALNLDKTASHISFKTDPSAMVSAAPITQQNKDMDGEENDKPTSMTLNIAANEFIPAKDVHDVPNISKIPSSIRPASRGHAQDEKSVASVMHAFEDQMIGQNQGSNMNEEKSRSQSKIPRLAGNEFYFPRKESEMSIREHREIYNQINSDIPIDKSEVDLAEFLERHSQSIANESHFAEEEQKYSTSELRKIHDQNISDVPFDKSQIDLAHFIKRQTQCRTGEGKIVTIGGEETFSPPNVPQKEEDEVEIDKFIRKMSKDIWSTGVIEPSNPSMPLIEADMSIKEFLVHRLKNEELKSADQNLNWIPYGVEELPTKQSSFSLHPQTSLTGSTAESREAIVDDDGFERNFPKVPSGNLSSVESTVWMDTNASFIIEEPTVSNYHHVKLSTGLREPFPRTSQNMDDNSSIDIPAIPQTDATSEPEITKKKPKKSIIRRISSFFQRRSSQKD